MEPIVCIFCRTFAHQTTEIHVEITELQALYARHPKVKALAHALGNEKTRVVTVSGLQASSAALAFAALPASQRSARPFLFVLDDMEEAGYFYHDLVQVLGEQQVLFFPSSFRRAVKFGQRDAASEILRTEVLAKLTTTGTSAPMVVSYPEAIAERVVSKKMLDDRTLQIRVGEEVDVDFVTQTLLEFGFQRTDYVYEPGQFAVRGSLVDVFSFSSEYPFRIDFFGNEVDSIRTFEVESQLSRSRQEMISLVPDLSEQAEERVPLATLLPEETMVVCRDITYVAERIGQIWEEGFSRQAMVEEKTHPLTPPAREGSGLRDEVSLLQKDKLLIDAQTFEHGFIEFRRIELAPAHSAQPTSLPRGLIFFVAIILFTT